MTNTIIHIGYPKTATTWFVRHFYPKVTNADVSFSDNIFYDLKEGNEKFEIRQNEQFQEKQNHIIVAHKLSGFENFKWDNGRYRKFFPIQLKKQFPEATIIVFIRNQIDFLASAYSSYLSHGGTYSFQDLFRQGKLGDGSMFSFEYLDYIKLIKHYENLFGKNKVHVFLYEEFLENNKIFLENFKTQFDLSIDLNKITYKKSNQKLRKGFALYYRFANMFTSKGVQPKKTIINLPWLFPSINKEVYDKINRNKIWGAKMDNFKILGADLIKYMEEYYKESNNLLLQRSGCESIKKYKYPL